MIKHKDKTRRKPGTLLKYMQKL